MKIELVGVNPVAPISVPPSTRSIPGKPNFVFQRYIVSLSLLGLKLYSYTVYHCQLGLAKFLGNLCHMLESAV